MGYAEDKFRLNQCERLHVGGCSFGLWNTCLVDSGLISKEEYKTYIFGAGVTNRRRALFLAAPGRSISFEAQACKRWIALYLPVLW